MVKAFVRLGVILVLAVALMTIPAPQVARAGGGGVCYVNLTASGANSGTSWANAYNNLQLALTNIFCGQVWVEAGVYKPGTVATDTFNIRSGLAVYGGFAGTETTLAERNPAAHVTILSGDVDNNDTNADGNNIDETPADIQGTNAYHVVTFDGTTTAVTGTTVLDGFTITGGSASGGFPYDKGGGMECDARGAGAVCSPNLENLTFIGNTSANWGGAVSNDSDPSGMSSPAFTNVSFINNTAGNGGAMVNLGDLSGDSSPSLLDVTFSGNAAATDGGAILDEAFSGNSNPSLTDVTFANNAATAGNGGAIRNDAPSGGTSNPSLVGVTFFANAAGGEGGAIYDYGTGGTSNPYVVNDILWADTAVVSGPEISNVNAVPSIGYSDVRGSGGSGGAWDTSIGFDLGANIDADPLLAPLANNGGFTKTMALIWGSPVIDTGFDLRCPPTDQRGVSRPQGSQCDMGAYERIRPTWRADFGGSLLGDLSVFRPSTGAWYLKNEFNTSWGQAGDVPVPADYNGDHTADVAIWRPSTGLWSIKGQFNTTWGVSGDVPVPGDYNGDGVADIAVWRPSTGTWYVKGQFTQNWGQAGDIPVPADYNGDGKTELAVFRPSTGTWYIKGVGNFAWGTSTDIPVPTDYNGDGRADIAVFRPSTGVWYVKGLFNSAWGTSTDIPVPDDFNADGKADVAIWRPSTGQWMVKNQFTMTWGTNGDFPLVAPDTNGNGTPYQ